MSLHDAVLASASIPVVFPPTPLGGEHYVDGGVREILPLALAFNQLGAGHIFAVVASAPGVDPWGDAGDRGLFDIARRVTADIGPDETLRKEIEPPRGWGRRVTVIVPEFDVHDALTIDPELIAASIDYGYMRAADVLLDSDAEQCALSAEIARTRVRLRADAWRGSRACSRARSTPPSPHRRRSPELRPLARAGRAASCRRRAAAAGRVRYGPAELSAQS